MDFYCSYPMVQCTSMSHCRWICTLGTRPCGIVLFASLISLGSHLFYPTVIVFCGVVGSLKFVTCGTRPDPRPMIAK